MRKRDRKALCGYIRWVADTMDLRDWVFDVSYEPPSDPEAYATCRPILGRRRAVLKFCADFREMEPDVQRNTIVHELVHCHMAGLQSQAELDLESLLGKPTDAVFFSAFRRNVEYAVDGLAGAIAKHMPYIDWPER